MNILYIDFTLRYKSLDIFVSGCNGNPKCKNCSNPESWDFDLGELYNSQYFLKIKKQVIEFDLLIDNIMIFGGEPLDQNYLYLLNMMTDLKTLDKKIWLFTRYELNEVPLEIKVLCDYIKTGRYIPELATEDNIQYGIKIASSNQKIHKIEWEELV